MASRRRSRIKSIAGNINDVQKRLRYLETRPAPAQLARKVVQTGNIALRAIEPDVVADAAIVRRTLAPEAVISANLAVVGDPDDAAVARENIQISAVDTDQINNSAVTNEKLAGEIEDGKLIGISASKVGPDLLVDDQIETLSASKVGPDLLVDDQLESISASKVGPDLLVDDQLESISASKIGPDLIVDDQLDGISTEKLIGSVLDDQIDSISAVKIGPDLIQDEQIDGISGEKIIGGIDGELIVAQSIAGSDTLGTALSKFTANSIGQDDIATDAIGFDEIQVDAVGTAQLQENSVVGVIIDSLAIERRHLNDDVIIARMINAGAVQTAGIQNLAVTGAKIANGTIDSTKLGSIGSAVWNSLGLQAPIGGFFGQGLANLRISVGTGSTQVAAGDHVHAGGTTVPGHTHPFTITQDGSNNTGGASAGTAHTHNYGRATGGTVGTNSTIRVKKEVSEYNPVDINKLLNLKLMKYKYKNEYRHLHPNREWMYGYMAEDLIENDFEEVIGYDKEGLPDTVNYGLISVFVLELVKKHQNEIDSLKEEIQRLKEAK
jgi:hypothetical protein